MNMNLGPSLCHHVSRDLSLILWFLSSFKPRIFWTLSFILLEDQ